MDDLAPRSRTGGILILVSIFVMGLVCGASLFYLGQRSVEPPPVWGPGHPGGPGRQMRLADELGLDDDQRRQVEAIVQRSRSEVHGILESSRAEIREVLTPEQQKEFERMRSTGRRGYGRGKAPLHEPPPPSE